MIPITLSNVSVVFNQKAILTPAERFQNRLLHKFGGSCRKTQQYSLRRGSPGQVSKPGKPPLRHATRPDFKYTVFYFADVRAKDVVIGPVLLSGKSAASPVPQLLEKGGLTRMSIARRRNRRAKKIVDVNISARPSARPAFEKTINKQLPALIKGGIMAEA